MKSGTNILYLVIIGVTLLLIALKLIPPLRGSGSSKHVDAYTSVQVIEVALSQFNIDCGRYPTTAEGLEALRHAPAPLARGVWRGPYIEKQVGPDPWGHPYIYRCPGLHNPSSYDLSSGGEEVRNWFSETNETNVNLSKQRH